VLAFVCSISACTYQPTPLSGDDFLFFKNKSLNKHFQAQEAVSNPLSIYDVIARTLQYNTQRRVAIIEKALSDQALVLSTLELLPKLVIDSGFSNRSKFDIRDTKNPETGEVTSNPTSIGSEKRKVDSSLSLSWDILDFGLNYARLKQAGDRTLIAHERKRLATAQLVSEIQESFWAAYTAQRFEPLFGKIESDLEQAFDDLTSKELRDFLPMKSLNEQRRLLQLKRRVIDIRTELLRRQVHLGNLMGLPPEIKYQLSTQQLYIPFFHHDLEALDNLAFKQRPELFISSYESRINAEESKARLLDLFPGVGLSASLHHTTDDLVVNSQWFNYSVQVGWHMLKLFQLPKMKQSKKLHAALDEQRRLAIGMTLLMQNRLASLNYQQALKAYGSDVSLEYVEDQILYMVLAAREGLTAQATSIDEIRSRLSNIVAALDSSESYGRAHRAYFEVMRSAGFDVLPKSVPDPSLATLSKSIEKQFNSILDVQNIVGPGSLKSIPPSHSLFTVLKQIADTWVLSQANHFSDDPQFESSSLSVPPFKLDRQVEQHSFNDFSSVQVRVNPRIHIRSVDEEVPQTVQGNFFVIDQIELSKSPLSGYQYFRNNGKYTDRFLAEVSEFEHQRDERNASESKSYDALICKLAIEQFNQGIIRVEKVSDLMRTCSF